MADFKTWRITNWLEFECSGFDKRNNFSEGSFKPKRNTQVIGVQGRGSPHKFFELKLLVDVIALRSTHLI